MSSESESSSSPPEGRLPKGTWKLNKIGETSWGMKSKLEVPNEKNDRRRRVRLQKSRLAEVEVNLRLLLSNGLAAKKSDAAILATAPRVSSSFDFRNTGHLYTQKVPIF